VTPYRARRVLRERPPFTLPATPVTLTWFLEAAKTGRARLGAHRGGHRCSAVAVRELVRPAAHGPLLDLYRDRGHRVSGCPLPAQRGTEPNSKNHRTWPLTRSTRQAPPACRAGRANRRGQAIWAGTAVAGGSTLREAGMPSNPRPEDGARPPLGLGADSRPPQPFPERVHLGQSTTAISPAGASHRCPPRHGLACRPRNRRSSDWCSTGTGPSGLPATGTPSTHYGPPARLPSAQGTPTTTCAGSRPMLFSLARRSGSTRRPPRR